MNELTIPPMMGPQSREWSWVRVCLALLLASLVATVGAILLVAGMIWSGLRVGPDAAALRNACLRGHSGQFQKRMELSLGRVHCGLIRFGLGFAPLPDEVGVAVASLKAAEVAVYELHGKDHGAARTECFVAADEVMSKRGWERLVGVVDRDQLVMIFVPREVRSEGDLRFCLAVQDRLQLVVVSARTDLEPLLALSAQRFRSWGRGPLAGTAVSF